MTITENRKPIPAIPAGTLVLITGATGFTGQVLTRKLCGLGLSVRAIARASSNISPLEDLDIEWIRGDVFDSETVKNAVKDVEYIFHVAAAYRDPGISDLDYRNVHVESTKLLAQEASKLENFKRFVHTSTVGVHGHIENPPIDEEGPFNPGDIYQVTKVEAENWLHGFAEEHGLPYTVIRPAAIYGPGDKRLLKVFKMASKPVFLLLGSGKCLYHLIHVDDLTNVMILAATHPEAARQAFIVGSPEAVTLENMGRIIAEKLGVKHRILRLPVWPFFVMGDICEFICKPLGISPPIYRRRVAFFTKDRSFNTKKLRERLGYKCKYTDEEGLAATAKWYRDKGWL